MSTTSRPPESLIAAAAAMRAACESWDAIAAKIGRSCGRLRHWPRDYPDEWNRAYRAAQTELLHQAADEALVTLRRLNRSQNEKIALAAAKELSSLRLKMRELDLREAEAKAAAPQPVAAKDGEEEITEDDRHFLRAMHSMTDEEMEQSYENDLINYARQNPAKAAIAYGIAMAESPPDNPAAAATPIIAPESECPAPKAA